MGIMNRKWTTDDERRLESAKEVVARLENRKAMIERIGLQAVEQRFGSVYKSSGKSKLRSTF